MQRPRLDSYDSQEEGLPMDEIWMQAVQLGDHEMHFEVRPRGGRGTLVAGECVQAIRGGFEVTLSDGKVVFKLALLECFPCSLR